MATRSPLPAMAATQALALAAAAVLVCCGEAPGTPFVLSLETLMSAISSSLSSSAWRLGALAMALGLAGCGSAALVQHDAQAAPLPAVLPALAPAAGVAQRADLAIDRWWTLFNDPALDALVAQVLARNHDLEAAAARVREARAQLDEVRGAQSPSLDLQAQHARSRQSRDGALPPGADPFVSNHKVQLAAQYDVDLWGRLASGSEAARQRLLSQEWARAALQWSLTAQVAEAHFSLRAVQRQIDLSDAVRDSRGRTVKLRRAEFDAGSASALDLRRAEAELAGTAATLASLQRQRAALEATLALLAGQPVERLAMTEPARQPLDTVQPFVAQLPQGDAAQWLVRRPDLRQAEARLAAARADIQAARAATLPALRLSGAVGSDVRSLSNLFNAPGFVWSAAAGVTQSLFDGGQAKARVKEADARADAALADYRQAVLAAVVELRQAYVELDLTQQAQRAEQDRVVALEQARRLAELGYAHGALGQLDLLDAERNAWQAQLNEVTATRDRLIGQVAAFKALGG